MKARSFAAAFLFAVRIYFRYSALREMEKATFREIQRVYSSAETSRR